jgi:hypothetical protein
VQAVRLVGEVIDVEVRVHWAAAGREAICVEAVANGPSCWRLERLEDSITVPAPASKECG